MKKISRSILPLLLLLAATGSQAADTTFYKSEPGLFSWRPKADQRVVNIKRFGPVGLGIDLIQPTFTMKISNVEPGSPAAATGGFKKGQYIATINGQKLKDIDPRIQLGNIITKAEASDGKILFQVSDSPGGDTRPVLVQIDAVGSFSETWPVDCPKSDKIVRNFAEYLKTKGSDQGFANIGMLFLLSTGDPDDLEYVAKWARGHKGGSGYPWHIGYGGLALCEYYLRTGDEQVLPAIQSMADHLVEIENFGGWAGRGSTAQLSYGGGGGHLNAAGTLCVAYLMMAVECGADVPDETLERVLERFYRYSARGNVPYGQGKPEAGFTDNGKNGKLAFSMAAAANLTPKGDQSIYARARDASAQFSFYSTSYMLHGHTGGGIGEIWRSAAMGLVHDDLPRHYREFMDARRWHYEMSRRYDGSFGILDGARYDEVSWGAAYALTYTVPRKTLRLTGAPPTKWSKTRQLPERPWGTAEDDDFQSIQAAVMPDGTRPDISKETFEEHSGMHLIPTLRGADDVAMLQRYIHHPDYVIRSVAAGSIARLDPKLLKELIQSEDARVRRAALEGIDSQAKTLLTRELFKQLTVMIRDEEESWFVKDLALEMMGKAPADWLVTEVDLLLPYLEHEEWWFQKSALSSLVPVAADERVYRKILPAIGELLQTNYRYNVSSVLRWGNFPKNIRQAGPEVQALARESLQAGYANFVEIDHATPRVEKMVNTMNRDLMVQLLAGTPGGYDALYAIGKQQNPNEKLPFREIFLVADPANLSPELQNLVNETVGSNLIPKYIAEHRESLLEEARSEGELNRRGHMPKLIDLYEKLGITQYSWGSYGPAREAMKWDYFSFDPKEKFLQESDRLGRYREVTFPRGMQNWYAEDFNAQENGWKTGLAPFGAADGELARVISNPHCDLRFCGCNLPLNTLWEKEALLIRGEFEFPDFEEGYRYRLLHGGISHVGSGSGYRIYVNGKLFHEDPTGVDRRGGGKAEGAIISAEWWPEFEGPVTLAAISFKKNHPRTKKYGGNICFFIERQKVPPIEEIVEDNSDSGELTLLSSD